IVIRDVAPAGLADYRAFAQHKIKQAGSVSRKGAREFVLRRFDGQKDFPISNFITLTDNVRLIFDGDTRLVPAADANPTFTAGEGIRSHGGLPTHYVALAADALFGQYWLEVAETSGFLRGQH